MALDSGPEDCPVFFLPTPEINKINQTRQIQMTSGGLMENANNHLSHNRETNNIGGRSIKNWGDRGTFLGILRDGAKPSEACPWRHSFLGIGTLNSCIGSSQCLSWRWGVEALQGISSVPAPHSHGRPS